MKKRYRDSSQSELEEELRDLKDKLEKATKEENSTYCKIYERKIEIVQSYMLNPANYLPNEIYTLKKDPGYTFKIDEISGIIAWGYRINLLDEMSDEREAFPIALLGEKVQ